uniref:Uncharacterized protein n=1 Tax=Glossina morsitans morsitans TaxID=37546 RepID=A0A1B0GF59_GLOMM
MPCNMAKVSCFSFEGISSNSSVEQLSDIWPCVVHNVRLLNFEKAVFSISPKSCRSSADIMYTFDRPSAKAIQNTMKRKSKGLTSNNSCKRRASTISPSSKSRFNKFSKHLRCFSLKVTFLPMLRSSMPASSFNSKKDL